MAAHMGSYGRGSGCMVAYLGFFDKNCMAAYTGCMAAHMGS
eukprot:CAMPEP_0202897480 /NCGR_PEP_ID=MMETSP1392-20130828/6225_1 /ASSEMBLY_ACC=CAM_ASM_000868 /TAXON_ID=225041 /ORGANISM="Chlamydomonas chlamydogama, Strain SAG 11-48b" /LENGTH=40 /DNA_ID= /DNA_START= /DNA_END= /DNA_ORIENTATION=